MEQVVTATDLAQVKVRKHKAPTAKVSPAKVVSQDKQPPVNKAAPKVPMQAGPVRVAERKAADKRAVLRSSSVPLALANKGVVSPAAA